MRVQGADCSQKEGWKKQPHERVSDRKEWNVRWISVYCDSGPCFRLSKRPQGFQLGGEKCGEGGVTDVSKLKIEVGMPRLKRATETDPWQGLELT